MSDFLNTIHLLTGQAAPFTGQWVEMGRSRENLFSAFGTASGTIRLQYRSPFFIEQGVPFYDIVLSGSGHAVPVFSTSPMELVRAISVGSGAYWCAVSQQN
jgi:hypothetical protein